VADQRFDRDDVERILTPATPDKVPLGQAAAILVVVTLVAIAAVLYVSQLRDEQRETRDNVRAIRGAVERPCR
jgi:hypothetical protein